MNSRAVLLLFFLSVALSASPQKLPQKGVPQLENFLPAQYQNKGKIWDIRSAQNGMIYMAADQGLLEYDGKTWNSYKGSSGFTRSLLLIGDTMIYSGSDLDFGVWKKNKYQAFEYQSLYPFLDDVQKVSEEFWDVHQLNGNIVFVSSQNIYIYKNQQLTIINAPNKFSGSFLINHRLFFADEINGLYELNGLVLEPLFNYPDNIRFSISGMYETKQGLIIITRNSGLYLFDSNTLKYLDSPLSETLKIANVFCFEQIDSTHLAFGTILKGLYVTDLKGTIIHHINKHKGLPNNTILSLHYSPSGKLWIGMDYGISSLDINNNLTYFYDYRGDFGTGHTASLINDYFYLGTNQGLYYTGWEDLNNDGAFYRFQLIPGSEGQVWSLKHIDNTLFVGHDLGLFFLEGESFQKISNQHGVWTIIPYKDYILTGNYNGIAVFKKSEGKWILHKNMDLILGSCNQLLIERDNILWVNIPNFGFIRAVLDSTMYPEERLIFPEQLFIGNNPGIIKDSSGINVITDRAQYTYDEIEKTFTETTGIINYPKTEALLPGVYQAVVLHPDYQFFPIYNGFAIKSLQNAKETHMANNRLICRKIEAFNNDTTILLYAGVKIPNKINNVRIHCIVPNQNNVLYQYKLSESGDWSDWTTDVFFEFFNLRFGEYTFLVRARVDGEISETVPISFQIAAPWYQSLYARAAFVLLLVFLVIFILYWQKTALKKQKKAMLIKEKNSLREQAQKYRHEIMILEQRRLKAEHNQLKLQLKSKTVELANKAKDNEDKNRLIMSLKDKCDAAQQNPALSRMKWGEIQRLLDTYLSVEDKTFEIQMDELHQEFFKKLKERFPALSIHDLRLCAYLKIGLNSKEIAEILNILPSSAFISRSRLRKKLNLKVDEDLHDFLNMI